MAIPRLSSRRPTASASEPAGTSMRTSASHGADRRSRPEGEPPGERPPKRTTRPKADGRRRVDISRNDAGPRPRTRRSWSCPQAVRSDAETPTAAPASEVAWMVDAHGQSAERDQDGRGSGRRSGRTPKAPKRSGHRECRRRMAGRYEVVTGAGTGARSARRRRTAEVAPTSAAAFAFTISKAESPTTMRPRPMRLNGGLPHRAGRRPAKNQPAPRQQPARQNTAMIQPTDGRRWRIAPGGGRRYRSWKTSVACGIRNDGTNHGPGFAALKTR